MTQTQTPHRILVIKTGALGDVLRTTSILPGLHERHGAGLEVFWVTAAGAVPLLQGLEGNLITRIDVAGQLDMARLKATPFNLIVSLDDEQALCDMATDLAGGAEKAEGLIVGAYSVEGGARAYTQAAGPWFDMGLISVHGKAEADRMKIANQRSHPEILAGMLGIQMGEPQLVLEASEAARDGVLRIGLNTGAGGRWRSKALPEERVVALAQALAKHFGERKLELVLLGGPEESERNLRLAGGIAELAASDSNVKLVDTGCGNGLLDFAELVDGLDLLITSDSMALHMATARKVPVVSFFAPTSAAEIELYGRGAKVISTSPDFCSYARDADTSSLTVDRLMDAVVAVAAAQAS